MSNSFTFFKSMFPKIVKGSVLDFGFGQSRFIGSDFTSIDHSLYAGIDIDLDQVNLYKNSYSSSQFYHYDLTTRQLPDIDKFFDVSISYDLLTTCDIDTFFEITRFLIKQTMPGGFVILNFLNSADQILVDYYMTRNREKFTICDQISTPKWQYISDGRISYEYDSTKDNLLFIDQKYLLKELDLENIKILKSYMVVPNGFFNSIFLQK